MRASNKLGAGNLHEPVTAHVRKDFTVLRADATVGETLAELRTRNLGEKIVYFYVTDREGRLVGVVPTRKLLMTPPQESVSSIMVRDVVAIPEQASVLEACELFIRHRFLAFPVTDGLGRIVGVVDVNLFTDEAMTTVEQHQAERVFQLLGMHVALGRKVAAWRSFMDRFPWLLCNIAGGIICAFIASFYEAFLDTVIILALFIPVVLALSESVSMQSMTLTLASLEHQKIHWLRFWVNLRKEFATAVMLGAGSGATVGVVAWAWRASPPVALALGGSICLAMLTSCLLGVAIPTVVRALRRDPRIAAGPIVLATADVATLVFYFNLSGWLIG